MRRNSPTATLLQDLLTNLTTLIHADTLYHDVYIQRARYYLDHELSYEDYLDLKRMKIRAASLPNQIRNAMIRSDWSEVHELSGRDRTLQKELEHKRPMEKFARAQRRLKATIIWSLGGFRAKTA